jgi:K+-transporting ATPase c subunit
VFSQLFFKHQADGSITANGSTLIGQNWSDTKCPGRRVLRGPRDSNVPGLPDQTWGHRRFSAFRCH